jgi:hypothetical protein
MYYQCYFRLQIYGTFIYTRAIVECSTEKLYAQAQRAILFIYCYKKPYCSFPKNEILILLNLSYAMGHRYGETNLLILTKV